MFFQEERKTFGGYESVVGSCDILFVCLDTLRYDVAVQEKAGSTPVLTGMAYGKNAPGPAIYLSSITHVWRGFALPMTLKIWQIGKCYFSQSCRPERRRPKGLWIFRSTINGRAGEGWLMTQVRRRRSFFDKRSILERYSLGFFKRATGRPFLWCR